MDDERAILQVIDERDKAEETLSQMYFLITGRSPEWSNLFGHEEAVEDVDDAQRCLRAEIADHAARLKIAEDALRAANRLLNGRYLEWTNAGGPNQCKHGRADGIPCPLCDEATVRAALGENGESHG